MDSPSWIQLLLGALTLVAALMVVSSKNAVVAAVSLMACLFFTGALYFGLGAWFLGAVQILVYAGAISVLFVFVVMLLDMKPVPVRIPGRKPTLWLAALASGLFFVLAAWKLFPAFGGFVRGSASLNIGAASDPVTLSGYILSNQHLAFQMAGLLILATVMGVVVLGKPRKEKSKNLRQP
jgi:NADH-quinone oxidoreductase subunit J